MNYANSPFKTGALLLLAGIFQGCLPAPEEPKPTPTPIDEEPAAHTIGHFISGKFVVDLDSDGDLDVLVPDSPSIWEENQDNAFTPHELSFDAALLFSADMDGDEDIDIVAVSQDGNTITLYRNDGSQTFDSGQVIEAAAGFPLPSDMNELVLTDLNGNERVDILTTGQNQYWYKNTGGGNFSRQKLTSNNSGRSIATADINQDGHMDYIDSDGDLVLYLNDGNQNFTSQVLHYEQSIPYAIDIDGDDDIDIVAASSNKLFLFENDGTNNFTTHDLDPNGIEYWDQRLDLRGHYEIPELPTGLYVSDINDDGHLDMLNASRWYINDGNNKFIYQTAPILESVDLIELVQRNTPSETPECAGAHPRPNAITELGHHLYGQYFIDLDNDSDLDVLSIFNPTYFEDPSYPVWYENHEGQYITHVLPFEADQMSAADMDGDGDIDIVALNNDNYQMRIYKNDGMQGFTNSVLVEDKYDSLGFNNNEITLADMNNDGIIDIMGSWRRDLDDRTVRGWYKYDGDSCVTKVQLDDGHPDGPVYIADVDNDGRPDYVESGSEVIKYTAQDLGYTYTKESIGYGHSLAFDIDSDDKNEVFFTSGWGNLSWYRYENDTYNLIKEIEFWPEDTPYYTFFVSDINDDGFFDIMYGDDWFKNDGSYNFSKQPPLEISRDYYGEYEPRSFDLLIGIIERTTLSENPWCAPRPGNQNTSSTIGKHIADKLIVDMDSDGDLDIVSPGYSSEWEEYENGSFVQRHSLPMMSEDTQAADMDADGDIDLVSPWPGGVSLFRNDGQQNFTEIEMIIVDGPEVRIDGIHLVDYDANGHVDIVSYGQGQWLFKNDGSPCPEAQRIYSSTYGDAPIYPFDFNNDGLMDHVSGFASSNEGPGIIINYSDASGDITPTRIYDNSASFLSVLDIDGDADIDILAITSNGIELLINDGTNSFTVTTIAPSSSYGKLSVADVNGDGFLDILDGDHWYKNDGDYTFEHQGSYGWNGSVSYFLEEFMGKTSFDPNCTAVPPTPDAIAGAGYATEDGYLIDLDSDGDLDILEGDRWIEYIPNTPSVTHSLPFDQDHVMAADMDGDGDIDILGYTLHGYPNHLITVYYNDGAENFHARGTNIPAEDSVSLADMNNDGHIDVMVGGNNQRWYKNNGSSCFVERPLPSGSSDSIVFAFDLNNDGHMDFIESTDSIKLHMNDGQLNFQAEILGTQGAKYSYPIDIEGDGDIDILSLLKAVEVYETESLVLFKNDGSNNFTQTLISDRTDVHSNVFAVDINGDRHLDILNGTKGFRNNGSVQFSEVDGDFWPLIPDPAIFASDPACTATPANPDSVLEKRALINGNYVIDIDSDGDLDVLTPNSVNVTWQENLGGSFSANSLPFDAEQIIAADMNGDNHIDIIAQSQDGITLYINDGSETFTGSKISDLAPSNFESSNFYVADMDNDNRLDVVTANGDAVWHRNNGSTCFASITLDSISSIGSRIIIADVDGDNFKDIIDYSESLTLYINSGFQQFAATTTLHTGANTAHAVDIDGDSDMDLIKVSGNELELLENDGAANFVKTSVSLPSPFLYGLYATDVDDDDHIDVLYENRWLKNDGSNNLTLQETYLDPEPATLIDLVD